MTLGGAAQVAAAHCPNERTFYGLHPAMFSGNDSLFLVTSITRY